MANQKEVRVIFMQEKFLQARLTNFCKSKRSCQRLTNVNGICICNCIYCNYINMLDKHVALSNNMIDSTKNLSTIEN